MPGTVRAHPRRPTRLRTTFTRHRCPGSSEEEGRPSQAAGRVAATEAGLPLLAPDSRHGHRHTKGRERMSSSYNYNASSEAAYTAAAAEVDAAIAELPDDQRPDQAERLIRILANKDARMTRYAEQEKQGASPDSGLGF